MSVTSWVLRWLVILAFLDIEPCQDDELEQYNPNCANKRFGVGVEHVDYLRADLGWVFHFVSSIHEHIIDIENAATFKGGVRTNPV